MRRRRVVAMGVLLAGMALLSACSSSPQSPTGPGGPLPVVDQIAPAIAALEAALGGPQEYVEINADAQMVSMITYDATESQARAYRYLQGVLTPASEPFEISGGTPLRAQWITFDPEIIFDTLRTELPTSTVVAFVVLAGQGQTATYEALVQSSQGGRILVTLGPQGQVLSVQPL